MPVTTKKCMTCGRPLQGRVDKKFCDDYCRSAYNNRKYTHERGYIRKVNHLLLRNRRILASYVLEEKENQPVPKELLYSKGFQFDYFTHTEIAEDGARYYCCYDHAYQLITEQELKICKLRGRKDNLPTPYNES